MNKRNRYTPPSFLTHSGHGHFTALYDDLINSEAFIGLSPQAAKMLLYLYQQYKAGFTGDTVTCPYSYFEARGFRHASISKYLGELEHAGFIRIMRGGLMKTPNRYRLIGEWYRAP